MLNNKNRSSDMFTFRKLFLCLLATVSLNLQAQVIVDTGPALGESGLAIFNQNDEAFQAVAGNFVLSGSYTITDVLASFTNTDSNSKINISIHKNLNNEPGDQLFTQVFTTNATTAVETWAGLSDLSLNLDTGSYWVVFSGIRSEISWLGWRYGATNPLASNKVINHLNGYPPRWLDFPDESPGLKILGTPLAVPEPDRLVMLIAGLGLLAVAIRRTQ